MIFYLFYYFILGLIAGSFANVCIHRIPKDLSIVLPGSFCPNCKNSIKWFDNLPLLSFLILRGKCRYCGDKISFQYPLVEILTGILFLIIGWHFSYSIAIVSVYLIFTLLLVVISVIDLYHQIIPDALSLAIFVLGLGFCFFNQELGFTWKDRLLNSVLGGFISAICLYLIGYLGSIIFKKEAMGGGDIKLILAIGTLIGLKKAFIVLFLASLIGSIVGILLIVLDKNKRDEYIPFGPFISFAAYISLFISNGWFIW